MTRVRAAATALLTLAGLLAAGCATNPVTGNSDLVIMSEKSEIQVGRQQHQIVLQQMGSYDDERLQAYVTEVGTRLAKASHRPNLEYTFTVVDTEDVNAFALPGGFIYISRGILPYLNSEAELAAVLGHEIGHVTARHGVKRQAQGTLAGIGAAAAGILTGQPGLADLANVAGQAIVSGYGREQELEADRLGAEYLARTGYDPEAVIRVVSVLKAQESFEVARARAEKRDPRIYHGLFATHPDNDTRLQEAVRSAAGAEARATGQNEGKETFLQNIDGIAWGNSRAQGVVRDGRFYHADMGITMAFPRGWNVDNGRERILAVAPDKNSFLQVTGVAIPPQQETPRKFVAAITGNNGSVADGRELTVNGLPAYTALVRGVQTPFGVRPVRTVVVQFNNLYYRIDGTSRGGSTMPEADGLILSSAQTFRRLKDAEFALAEPNRIKLVKAAQGTTMTSLAAATPLKDYREETLRLFNALYPKGEPAPGTLVKTVR